MAIIASHEIIIFQELLIAISEDVQTFGGGIAIFSEICDSSFPISSASRREREVARSCISIDSVLQPMVFLSGGKVEVEMIMAEMTGEVTGEQRLHSTMGSDLMARVGVGSGDLSAVKQMKKERRQLSEAGKIIRLDVDATIRNT